jgi:flavin-dependent dehydrogenase
VSGAGRELAIAMRNLDVVIVGSGPAGMATALWLAREAPTLAERTVVLERDRHPREKICAGGLSQNALGLLAELEVDLPVPQVRVERAVLRYLEKELVARRQGTHGLVVRRAELDAWLARVGRERGLALMEEERVLDLCREGAFWRVVTHRRELRARVVVGADGVGSIVRRRAGFSKGRSANRLVLVERPVDPSATEEFREARITFDFSVVPEGVRGYAWDFPCYLDGRAHLSTGIFDRQDDPAHRVDLAALLARRLRARGERLSGHRLKSFPEREFEPSRPLSRPGILLVGEAAGIDPLVGEGIGQALEYGKLAAQEIRDGFERGNLSFRGWRRRVLGSRLGRTLLLYRFLADRIYGPGHAFWFSFFGQRQAAREALAQSFLGQGRHLRNLAVAARELLDFAASGR